MIRAATGNMADLKLVNTWAEACLISIFGFEAGTIMYRQARMPLVVRAWKGIVVAEA